MSGTPRGCHYSATMGKLLALSEQKAGRRGHLPIRERGWKFQEKRKGWVKQPALQMQEGRADRSGQRGCHCFEVLSCFMKAKGLSGLDKYYVGL